ncbi:MAG TPA: thioredoxin-disulfide reductase [Syntrophales bacterium]|jgi:thioredoxin reductase (NADPH)|nr:thioredoxin-disulfide reductase [Syntrophales bacterium]HON22882.1 thioredoxin-disulfide reductase [Syntrophales bacterium]HOU77283.1 thioredoxin-disulfide reductase [Syntrophales bacterium]HPC32713.1 thioredoxin-disulfide reductase [Syntrophales bacterium]HQG34226.1 thioredoxin-disulfide reductase [Syntrophales bacterium]
MEPETAAKIYDVIIVGGGPAGFTAGLYTARAGLSSRLISGASTVSQITITDLIENYPGIPEGINGFELMERFDRQARKFGLEVVAADVRALEKTAAGEKTLWRVKTDDFVSDARAVIMATGAYWRKLGIPGEEEFAGRGVSYCATCDAPFYRNREVVVIGGGNTAVQEAVFLTHFAARVTIVHRRNRLRAAGILAQRALANPKITMSWNTVASEIGGDQGVEWIRVRDVHTGEEREIPAAGVFIFAGLIPQTGLVRDLAALEKDGSIIVDREMRTSVPGLFACGDCIHKSLRQVVTACGDGATAAYSAQLYVEDYKGEAY